jgi:kinesin family protein 2/24
MRICICIRKRPLFPKETANGEIDSVSMCNPAVIVHEPKVKVDGITKYI